MPSPLDHNLRPQSQAGSTELDAVPTRPARFGVTGAALAVAAVLIVVIVVSLDFAAITKYWAEVRNEALLLSMGGFTVGAAWGVWRWKAMDREDAELAAAEDSGFAMVADLAPVLIWTSGPDARWTFVNQQWCSFTGVTRSAALGDGWLAAVHPEDRGLCLVESQKSVSGQVRVAIEYRLRHADGSFRWVLDAAAPRFNKDGQFVGLIGSVVDITNRRADEQRVREALEQHRELLRRENLLRRELDHRVLNNLAGLLGLIALYERSDRDGHELARAVRGKVRAMKEVHELLSRGRGTPIDVAAFVGKLANEFVPADRVMGITLGGPSVEVPGAQAAALAMILQELFTNSRKHGALGTPTGTLAIEWSRISAGTDADGSDACNFQLVWTERGAGAALRSDGTGQVGLRLIEGLAGAELRGTASFEFGAAGFSCALRMTLDSVPDEVPVPPV